MGFRQLLVRNRCRARRRRIVAGSRAKTYVAAVARVVADRGRLLLQPYRCFRLLFLGDLRDRGVAGLHRTAPLRVAGSGPAYRDCGSAIRCSSRPVPRLLAGYGTRSDRLCGVVAQGRFVVQQLRQLRPGLRHRLFYSVSRTDRRAFGDPSAAHRASARLGSRGRFCGLFIVAEPDVWRLRGRSSFAYSAVHAAGGFLRTVLREPPRRSHRCSRRGLGSGCPLGGNRICLASRRSGLLGRSGRH